MGSGLTVATCKGTLGLKGGWWVVTGVGQRFTLTTFGSSPKKKKKCAHPGKGTTDTAGGMAIFKEGNPTPTP